MQIKTKTSVGTIRVDFDVIAKIAGITAAESYGVVGMAAKNIKDGIWHLLKRESIGKGVIIHDHQDHINIDMHIIVEYGTNIAAISESLIDSVKYKVEEFAEVKVEKVNVYVDGIRTN